MLSPLDVFDPSVALDPNAFSGAAGASRLMQAATQTPGGPLMLVFLLFWAPVGPSIPAGVLLAHHLRVPPPITFGLYALAVLLGASLVAAEFTDDDRYVSVVVIAVALLAQPIARRLFPSWRE